MIVNCPEATLLLLSIVLLNLIPVPSSHKVSILLKYLQGLIFLPAFIGSVELLMGFLISCFLSLFFSSSDLIPLTSYMPMRPSLENTVMPSVSISSDLAAPISFSITAFGLKAAIAASLNILLTCFISAGLVEESFKLLVGIHGICGDFTFFKRASRLLHRMIKADISQSTKKRYSQLASPTQLPLLAEKPEGDNDVDKNDSNPSNEEAAAIGMVVDDEYTRRLILLAGVAACSLGFATSETLGFLWIFQGDLENRFYYLLYRILFSFSLHVSCSLMGASRFISGHESGLWRRLLWALAPSIFLHGLFDAGCLMIHALSTVEFISPVDEKSVLYLSPSQAKSITEIWCVFIFAISIFCGVSSWHSAEQAKQDAIQATEEVIFKNEEITTNESATAVPSDAQKTSNISSPIAFAKTSSEFPVV